MGKNIDLIHSAKFWKPDIEDNITFFNGHFNSFEFDKHAHEEYTISLIHDGNMKGFLDGFSQHFQKSAILTINPDEVHACRTDNEDGYNYTSIYFNKSILEKLSHDEFGSKEIYFNKKTIFKEDIYNKLATLARKDELGLISKLEFECELIEVLKKIFILNSHFSNEKVLNNHDKMVLKAKEFINDNFFLDLSLDDISKQLDISKYHFLRLFKQKTHCSPHSYLMNRRVEKAKQLLQKGESLVNIAHSCGFSDQSHLHKRFKACVGITPKKYQNFFN